MQHNVEMNDLCSRVHVAELDWSDTCRFITHMCLTSLAGQGLTDTARHSARLADHRGRLRLFRARVPTAGEDTRRSRSWL